MADLCWPKSLDMDQEGEFGRFRITSEILDRARPDVLFIPCPPVSRGEEVSAEAMRHPRCLATMAKAYLVPSQNAFVETALADRGKNP
jgi:ornithine carbamoyltransferase